MLPASPFACESLICLLLNSSIASASSQFALSRFGTNDNLRQNLSGRYYPVALQTGTVNLEGLFMFSGGVFSGRVFSAQATRAALRFVDWLLGHTLPAGEIAGHHRTRPPGGEGGLLLFAHAGLHDGGAKLPLAALPRRNRPDRMGRRCSLLRGS